MCKNAGLLVGWDVPNRRVLVARGRCEQWSCEECAEWMRSNWKIRAEMGVRRMLAAGETADFVTITSHEKLPTFAATLDVFRKAWPTLYNAVKRRKPGLMYMIVPEQHKNGRMHIHVLWNANVTKRWLKNNARKRGMGYECEIKHMTESRFAVWYVTKYLSKQLGADVPKKFRRVRVSQNWPVIPKPDNAAAKLKWEYLTTQRELFRLAEECQKRHYDLLDLKTNVAFEDIDVPWCGAENP